MKRPDVFALINVELVEIGKTIDLNEKPNMVNCVDEMINLLQRAKNSQSKFREIELLDAFVRSAAISVNILEHYGY